MRLLAAWKQAVARAGDDLPRLGCGFVALDVATAASDCFAPALTWLLGLARLGAALVLAPAVVRVLAIRHADRDDADLLRAIAVALGVAALYVVVRTSLVVRACAL